MEIPDLVRDRLGDEEVRAGVSLGDEDAVCLTPTRTLVYRGEGLLSDESVTVLSHDVERIDVKEGRRKTSFTLEYVDGSESFTAPGSRSDTVLELLMDGVLRVADVTDPDESVRGVYRFSELTLILTDDRLVKHVGASLWDEDFEEFPFADLTGLEFEEGSVATQIVVSIDGRPQRIKAPNDEAPKLRQTLEQALFAYHGVDSLAALNEAVGLDGADGGRAGSTDAARSSDLTLDEGIDPLVGGDEPAEGAPDDGGRSAGGAGSVGADGSASDRGDSSAGTDASPGSASAGSTSGVDADASVSAAGSGSTAGEGVTEVDADRVSRADVEEIGEQLDALTTTVKRQNELLRKQQKTIQQLIEELRQGR